VLQPKPNGPQFWRKLTLELPEIDGQSMSVELLRPLPWLGEHDVSEGAVIGLRLQEMGIVGPALVSQIAPCPEIGIVAEGTHAVVGRFVHNAQVLELHLCDLDEPIGTTESHPFWSVDRSGWVPAGRLLPSERIKTRNSTAVVFELARSSKTQVVYNLEVHRAHNFYVSAAELLVHNSCPFSDEKAALVEMAKHDKKVGMTAADMQAYKDLNKTLPDPFPSKGRGSVHGPEAHPNRGPAARRDHGHVGPVGHIPIND
jgi:hypothetical protein